MPAFRSMVLRLSRDDLLLYTNKAFATYIGREQKDIPGSTLKDLAALTSGEVSYFFRNARDFFHPNTLLADAQGRVFELKTSKESESLDIVLDEVTKADQIEEVLAPVSGIPVEDFGEEELRTVRNPDVRFLTACCARLQGGGGLEGALSPMDQRIQTNAFIEEASEALLACGCTLTASRIGTVAGICGAPRYYADHALRSLEAAFAQLERIGLLRQAFHRGEKEMPPAGCGIAGGDALVGTFGSHRAMGYAAKGDCVELAERLAHIASPGEVLVAETALQNLLSHLPSGWQSLRAIRDEAPDISRYAAHAGDIQPLDDQKERGTWMIGPGLEEDLSLIHI